VTGYQGGALLVAVCPVCRWPAADGETCVECGWQLIGDYVLGPVTRSAEIEVAAALAGARRHYDLRAAVRAAGPVGERRDQVLLDRLARLARGGPVKSSHVQAAIEDVDRRDPRVRATEAGVRFALNRLVSGLVEAVAFIEIGPDAIGVQALVAGAGGVPEQAVGDSVAWADLLPLLPGDDDLRYLRMAGGVGVEPAHSAAGESGYASPDGGPATGVSLISVIGEAVSPVLVRLREAVLAAASKSRARSAVGGGNSLPPQWPYRTDIVLVRRTYEWPLLTAAADHAAAVLRPVAHVVASPGAGDLVQVVDDVAVQAPLRYAYDLILADVRRGDGTADAHADLTVSVASRELFAAGAAVLPGGARLKTVEVAASQRCAATVLALPIVVRHTPQADFLDVDALRTDRPLVAMAAMDQRAAGGRADLTVTLLRPGQVELADVPWLRPETAVPSWPALMADVPRRLPVAAAQADGLDLVVLVELGGDEQVVASRVNLARGVVEAFRGEPGGVRIALLGYRDHFGDHSVHAVSDPDEEPAALIVGRGLRSPAEARKVFNRVDRWQAVQVRDYHGAPVEEALQLIAGMGDDWKWSPEARHVLLVIGARPPHPPRVLTDGGVILPCPHGRSWQDALRRLSAERAIQCIAVIDRQVTTQYAEQAWRRLGAQGLYLAGGITAEKLAQAAGLASRSPAVELRLATYAGGQG
jgi:hypothetical protein